MIEIRIENAKQIELKLKNLATNKGRTNAIRRSMYGQAVLIRNMARQLASLRSGILRKRIGISRPAPRGGEVVVQVVSRAPHSHLIEFGTKPRRQKGGRYTGYALPHPFLRPAFAAFEESAMTEILRDMEHQIEVEASK